MQEEKVTDASKERGVLYQFMESLAVIEKEEKIMQTWRGKCQ